MDEFSDTCAVILAGGKGSRFKPYTDLVPKPMIPVGDDEKPVLEYIVSWIASYGLRDFVFLVGYRWKQIRNYFGHGEKLGVRIRYSVDGDGYSGTGGALLKAFKNGLFKGYRKLLVWYGDILAPLDVNRLLHEHCREKVAATIAVANKYQLPVGVAEVDENGYVRDFREKPWLDVKVTIGIAVLDPKPLSLAENELGKSFDLMGDYIPWLLRKGFLVRAFVHDKPWYDIGSLERYVKLPYEVIEAIEERIRQEHVL